MQHPPANAQGAQTRVDRQVDFSLPSQNQQNSHPGFQLCTISHCLSTVSGSLPVCPACVFPSDTKTIEAKVENHLKWNDSHRLERYDILPLGFRRLPRICLCRLHLGVFHRTSEGLRPHATNLTLGRPQLLFRVTPVSFRIGTNSHVGGFVLSFRNSSCVRFLTAPSVSRGIFRSCRSNLIIVLI